MFVRQTTNRTPPRKPTPLPITRPLHYIFGWLLRNELRPYSCCTRKSKCSNNYQAGLPYWSASGPLGIKIQTQAQPGTLVMQQITPACIFRGERTGRKQALFCVVVSRRRARARWMASRVGHGQRPHAAPSPVEAALPPVSPRRAPN